MKIFKNIKLIGLLFLFSACASIQTRSPNSYSESFQSSFCSTEFLARDPASTKSCLSAVEDGLRNADPQLAQRLTKDPVAQAEAAMATSTGAEKYPIKITKEVARFRDRFLGFLKNPTVREPLTRSFEASLRMRSQLLEKSLNENSNLAQYDLIIVGSGVHGIIALHRALAQNPKLKVLVLDEGDTAGSTFRYGKEVFNINSSNRRSGEDTRPVPGEGNINELPGLPIQVSDLTAVKYPTANDLGTSIVAGLYAAVREYPQVDILFNARANQFLEKARDPQFNESVEVSTNSSQFQIDSQKVILATGLGEPNLPKRVAESLERFPALKNSQNGKTPPRVLTFEDMIRTIASSNDPVSLFKDKKIGVVGKGDSANVFIEFLVGYAAREGYARSSAQDGIAEKIFGLAKTKKHVKNSYLTFAAGMHKLAPPLGPLHQMLKHSWMPELKNLQMLQKRVQPRPA